MSKESTAPLAPDARAIALSWLFAFGTALCRGDSAATTSLFAPTGWFRDVLALSWSVHSLEGTAKIHTYLSSAPTKVTDVRHYEDPWVKPVLNKHNGLLETAFEWETDVAKGRGYVRLMRIVSTEEKARQEDEVKDEVTKEQWKALSVCMLMGEIKGYEAVGHESGIYGNHTLAWENVLRERREKAESEPEVLIIGAGQTGLMITAACKQMGLRALLIERNERVGDLWRKRYPTLTLHTTRGQHEILYQPYPSTWPEFVPKDKYADWLETYAVHQDLILWTSSQMSGEPTYHDETRTWDVTINRAGQQRTVHPKHIVMATGTLGEPYLPSLKGRELFRGTVMHGAYYQGGVSYAGQRVVVVGAGNTSIDICQDLCFHKAASVTMVQRSQTCVIDGRTMAKHVHRLYDDHAPTYVGDLKSITVPLGLLKKIQQRRVHEMWEEDKEMFEKLRKGGLSVYMGPENQGHLLMVYERSGGYWVDWGGADLIASGEIKVKQGTEPVAFVEDGLVFADGTVLEADSVIFATGYISMRETATKMFGEKNMSRVVEDLYGLDDECELKGSYKPTGHPGLWFGTGGITSGRTMSRMLAIQLKAVEVGLMTV
ncbi:hypothetical protein EIP91_009124 [Steccherinum ochraceum]|uniref:FAD/NAD(P)-binding domain-containing protein n=1 Tax=Steccherinum ochraceum TaxID=92696 RepID=A0A4R0R222_9APHY|nr:hypothetical protein EIP91_009124 [Steccherinum ochraceum]